MEKITLRSYKSQFLIFGIAALVLASALIYWALTRDGILKVYGARLDASTSKVLLIIISLGPLIASINQFILYFSYMKYGEFVIHLGADQMDYPQKKSFKGFSKVVKNRADISDVKLIDLGKQQFAIHLYNADKNLMGVIPGEYAPYKTMKPHELCAVIHKWAVQ